MIDELKKIEEAYKSCQNIEGYEDFKYPSLKYTIYHGKMFDLFKQNINSIKKDIDIVKKRINDDRNLNKDVSDKIEKLDKVINKINAFEKEEEETHEFYEDYLIKVAKESDKIKDEYTEILYIKLSKEIINKRINDYLKIEKNFIIIKEIINELYQK